MSEASRHELNELVEEYTETAPRLAKLASRERAFVRTYPGGATLPSAGCSRGRSRDAESPERLLEALGDAVASLERAVLAVRALRGHFQAFMEAASMSAPARTQKMPSEDDRTTEG